MRTPITYYGGKQRLIKELIPRIPIHQIYVEAFTGGGALFFAKPQSEAEIINDINGNVTNFYRIAKTDFEELKKKVDGTLHSRETHSEAKEIYNNPAQYDTITRAWAFWVVTNQGFAGKIGSWAVGKKNNKMGNTLANKRDDFTKDYANRLKHVQIENKDALKVIKHYDNKGTFFYLDPPYFNSDCGHYKGYTETDYKNLLESLYLLKGKFLLSSYPSDILKEYIKKYGWHYKEIHQKVRVTQYTQKQKIEVLVWNYDVEESCANLIPKGEKLVVKHVSEKASYNQGMHFSNEKSKQHGAENLLGGAKNSGAAPLPIAKEVRNFVNSIESPNENKQLSLERCRTVLEQSGKKYTDEEILKIRKLLYKLGNLEYVLFNKLKTKLYDKLNPLRKGINGRASRQRHKHPLPERATGAILLPDRI